MDISIHSVLSRLRLASTADTTWLREPALEKPTGLFHSYDQEVAAIRKDGHIWEFITYLDYWVSGLFVVVEEFNKLKIK
jgi:hypothetical protein